MPGPRLQPLRPSPRRRALCLAHYSAALWSLGNGLTTGALVTYLALDLGAQGRHLSLILAMPAAVGLLRLAAPAVIRTLGGVKPACLVPLAAGYLLLGLLPLLGTPVRHWFPISPLAALVAVICTHQLLEHLGTVALWVWLGELVPRAIRGRYFARRQMWQLAALIPTLLAAGWFADQWRAMHPESKLLGYTLPNAVGVAALLAALVPLARMPGKIAGRRGSRQASSAMGIVETLLAPWQSGSFRHLIFFGCWLAFFNGITQSPQNIYPKQVLGIGVLAQSLLSTGMRLGQMGLSPLAGWAADRYGNRPTAIAAQLVTAIGPLFFLMATPETPWWLIGAYAAWSAYVGLNVCLPNMMLRLAPAQGSSFVAAYFAYGGLAYAAGTLTGGWLFDALPTASAWKLGPLSLDRFGLFFLAGWIARSLGAAILATIREPGAWTWREIGLGFRRTAARRGEFV